MCELTRWCLWQECTGLKDRSEWYGICISQTELREWTGMKIHMKRLLVRIKRRESGGTEKRRESMPDDMEGWDKGGAELVDGCSSAHAEVRWFMMSRGEDWVTHPPTSSYSHCRAPKHKHTRAHSHTHKNTCTTRVQHPRPCTKTGHTLMNM